MKQYLGLLVAGLLMEAVVMGQTLPVDSISLPAELMHRENQFSDLEIREGRLYLMPECRIQEGHAARLFSLRLSQLDSLRKAGAGIPEYQVHPIAGLDYLVNRLPSGRRSFEGLEAIAMAGNQVYMSIETNILSPVAYLLRGTWTGDTLALDTAYCRPVEIPSFPNGIRVPNAGFEAMDFTPQGLALFYEFNYFPQGNKVWIVDTAAVAGVIKANTLQALPFRITGIARQSRHHWLGVNFFYQGAVDSIYRPGQADPEALEKVYAGGAYHNYTRLVRLRLRGKTWRWKPAGDLPQAWWGLNVEGIACRKGGCYLINDKFTHSGPARSILLFVSLP